MSNIENLKAIIIPGNGGSNFNDSWRPYVKRELEKLGIAVTNVDFPDPIVARKIYWLPFIKELGADEHTILVGHSSGAVAAMRYAENNKILGSVLVGDCYTDLDMESEKESGYYDDPWNWDEIKKNQQWIIQFHSIDDPYIPIEEARYIHEHLNTEYYEFIDRGHFGSDKNQKEFPELVEAVRKKISSLKNKTQQQIWDQEHTNPTVLKQMDSHDPSGGIVRFFDFLRAQNITPKNIVEMGCGKGRNIIWLAQKNIDAYGFDFSPTAIQEAKKRATEVGITNAHFLVQDATVPWPFESDSFDAGIDCFASTDIDSELGRKVAIKEFHRILKPGGYLLAYLLSPQDEFHKEMILQSPVAEKNAFVHPTTGKFEKVFDEEEIRELYADFKIVKMERVEKMVDFFGKQYACKHFWVVLQK